MKRRFLLYVLLGSLVLINACQREYSFENGAGPSEGTLQDDGSGDCLPKLVGGAYVVGTALNGTTDYIEVQVDVTVAGSYSISTDTVNGIFFKGTGVFTATGLNTVRLKGGGTPAAAGIHNFIVSYGTSGCSISVTTAGSLAAFTLGGAPGTCTGTPPAGTYTVGTALTAGNTVNVNVNVTTIGAYTISTAAANGMTFTGSGTFTTLGPQSIVLSGSGTPATPGTTNIPVASGASSCSFSVTVVPAAAPATFTVNCGTAAPAGTYTVGTALGASNTVAIGVTVATVGSYTITSTPINGMTFTASGTFTTTGANTVTLQGSGTPTTAGANTIAIPSGATPCNFTVTVVAAAGAAVYVVNCGTAAPAGTYTVGTALGASNNVSIQVNVTTVGTYSISSTINGMTFAASGTFAATGPATITLAGSGTPTVAGANVVPVTAGTTPCNFTVTVGAAAGAAVYAVDCFSAIPNGTYTEGVALTAANTISIDVTVTTPGSYTITTTATNGMTFTKSGTFAAAGTQTVILVGSGTPAADGTFTIPVPSGTAPCSFDLDVDAAVVSLGTWSFNVGTTVHSGTIYEADFDNTTAPPFLIFYFLGDNGAGDEFEIDLIDLSGAIAANEQYNCATFTGTSNTGGVYYLGNSGTSYEADFTLVGNTMNVRVTSHNTTTKTIVGTFSGLAITNGGPGTTNITNGTFTVTYP